MKKKMLYGLLLSAVLVLTGLFAGCREKDNTLAPYTETTKLSQVMVEQNSFKPELTWVGGYASVIGINRGDKAALDTSLIWLIYQPGNAIHYPVRYGTLPTGAQDLTSQYAGVHMDSLAEDARYTYWVLKEDVWNQLSQSKGKVLQVDPSLAAATVKTYADSLKVSPYSLTLKTQNIDVFINISDVTVFGQLAELNVIQPKTSNNPTITWTITQSDVKDPLVSALGITEGNQYNENKIVWEVWSEEPGTNGKMVYGKKNLIGSPVVAGQQYAGTKVFNQYPAEGLKRNTDYYFWIANKNWDGSGRFLFTPNYAYVVFHTW
ncbi:MAG: hypothetical protein ACM3QX_05935 [Syntrophomonadaceae bacterium]